MSRFDYTEPEFYLPSRRTSGKPWFAALAREPEPAYFVFTQAKGGWRLALGPVPVPKDAPGGARHRRRRAHRRRQSQGHPGLVSQRCLTYLTDPTGVNGIRVSSGDPMRELRDEITRSAAKYRPDRVSVDVRLVTGAPAHSLALPDGASWSSTPSAWSPPRSRAPATTSWPSRSSPTTTSAPSPGAAGSAR